MRVLAKLVEHSPAPKQDSIWNSKKNCFENFYRVKGEIKDGVFTPFEGEEKTYKVVVNKYFLENCIELK